MTTTKTSPMNWEQLLSSQRLGKDVVEQTGTEQRTEFQRDYDRLIFSSAFRRLQNKTQVFPLPGSVFVHNRLTHSLEVSSVGRSLGNSVAQGLSQRYSNSEIFRSIESIVSAACLAHDMGNPPFGHAGEAAISSFFTEGKGRSLCGQLSSAVWADITHFDGNANAFRLLTHQFNGRRKGGFVLTYSTLAAIVKYPYSAVLAGKKNKFGFFESEKDDFVHICSALGIPKVPVSSATDVPKNTGPVRYARYPLVYLVEAADDICYQVMDIEDACKLHILTQEETAKLLLDFFDEDKQKEIQEKYPENTDLGDRIAYYRSCVIGTLIQACAKEFLDAEKQILCGTYEGSLIDHIAPHLYAAYQRCAETARTKIYSSKNVVDVELSGYRILSTLLETMVEAVCNPDNHASKLILKHLPTQYAVLEDNLDTRIMAVLDYLSGMTDLYALELFQKIQGQRIPIV